MYIQRVEQEEQGDVYQSSEETILCCLLWKRWAAQNVRIQYRKKSLLSNIPKTKQKTVMAMFGGAKLSLLRVHRWFIYGLTAVVWLYDFCEHVPRHQLALDVGTSSSACFGTNP